MLSYLSDLASVVLKLPKKSSKVTTLPGQPKNMNALCYLLQMGCDIEVFDVLLAKSNTEHINEVVHILTNDTLLGSVRGTALHLACHLGMDAHVNSLIKNKVANLDIKANNGYTALHFAACAKSPIICKLLLF